MIFTPPQALLGLHNIWTATYQQFNQLLVLGNGLQDNNHSNLQSVASVPVFALYLGGAIGATTSNLKLGPLSGSQSYIEGDNGLTGFIIGNTSGSAHTLNGSMFGNNFISAAGLRSSADPAGVAGATGLGITTGVGNGASTNMTALALGTGGGPTSLQAAGWVRVLIGTTSAWLPYFE